MVLQVHNSSQPSLLLSIISRLVKPEEMVLVQEDVAVPFLTTTEDESRIEGQIEVAHHIVLRLLPHLCGANVAEQESWISSSTPLLAEKVEKPKFGGFLKLLDLHLTLRTLISGYDLTLADIVVFSAIQSAISKSPELGNMLKGGAAFPNVKRYLRFVEQLQTTNRNICPIDSPSASPSVPLTVPPTPSIGEERERKVDERTKALEKIVGHLQKIPPLQHIDESGIVCTRFPPEPSGFLHVGHVKAALLNWTYANRYNGKLIIRFDDTNPTKEKDEYVTSILADLKTLGIEGQTISHTSDYFDIILDYAEKLIRSGKAYVDSTPSEEMRAQRMDGIESKFRNQSMEENLRLWEEMKKGSQEGDKCLLRARIDMQAKNKVLRDPGMFRCVLDTPHLRTALKYKAYPLYDFACPIVDSIEGVTHSFRSSEYHDRNVLYYWVLEALGLRKVYIEDFSRLNFSYTLLSKRKLQWFVDNGHVEGWNSPAFPTVQGILRRGLEVDVLKTFILAQGASKSNVMMDIDKLWALNRKFLDPIVPRYTAIDQQQHAIMTLTNNPEGTFVRSNPLHKKNADLGHKETRYSSRVLLERTDANQIEEGEEITLMDWGNAICSKLTRDEHGNVTSIEAALNPSGNVRTTKKKLTWLSDDQDLVPIEIQEFEYILTKKSLSPEDDDWTKFISHPLVRTFHAIGDFNLRSVKKGDKLQLERRGYFIVDRPLIDGEKNLVLIAIPEGRSKGMSSVSN